MNAEDKNNTPIDESENHSDQSTTDSPEDKLKLLEEKLAEAEAQVLYVKAEGENIRKRSVEDIDKARKFALERFSGELLSVKTALMLPLLLRMRISRAIKTGLSLHKNN